MSFEVEEPAEPRFSAARPVCSALRLNSRTVTDAPDAP
jgi:hypothetical protein